MLNPINMLNNKRSADNKATTGAETAKTTLTATDMATSFENSAMKASFSLSSLQQGCDVTPDRAVKPRMCNSLTKNGRKQERNNWRKSWGSTASDQKDDFWMALQANYNFIMDNHLIDNCQETNGELSKEIISTWSPKEFYGQFSELYSWLNSVQEAIYGREETMTDKALRVHYMNTVLQKNSLWKLFNEQASQIMLLHPELQEEVSWRVNHLNAKWDSILSILGPSDCDRCEQEACVDVEHEVKCLRMWLKNMETRLPVLDFRTKFTKTEIENKASELTVLHRDVETHGKIVGSVVKLCKRTDGTCGKYNGRRVANGLERRYHLLFLRSLEWQCYVENLSKKTHQRHNSYFSDSDEYDGEPVSKYPRLSNRLQSNNSGGASAHEDDNEDNNTKEMSAQENEMINDQKNVQINSPEITPADTSQFTQSNRKAPNLATYYFRHEDTDSDMDKVTQLKPEETTTSMEETSEDEWTYQRSEAKQTENTPNLEPSAKAATSKTLMQNIRRLVQEAEELVSPEKCKLRPKIVTTPINKISRVKEWLEMEKPGDSCDASGEDDEQESQTSEELNESIATYRAAQEMGSQNTSFGEVDSNDATPKSGVNRRKYNLKGNRPWSVSCISQLSCVVNNGSMENEVSMSISESALNKLSFSPSNFQNSANVGVQGNNSTSSTVEESGAVQVEERTSPARRKRLKFKKRTFRNKSESSANGGNYPSLSCRNLGALTKSGSFSGCSNRLCSNDRHTSSDPSALHVGQYGNHDETSTTSGADTDEDKNRRLPAFRLGHKTGYLNFDSRDDSPGKNSLNTAEEQSSSLSEQAWDSYQEKYLSEAYSEAHDSDAARRLLEFGEDYRNYLDSQSDWSQSTNPEFSPIFKRKSVNNTFNEMLDSDEEVENMRQLLQESKNLLEHTKSVYLQSFKLGLQQYLVSNDIGEMLGTCDRHVQLLDIVEQSPEEYSLENVDRKETSGLLLNWQYLRSHVVKMQTYRDLQREMKTLGDEFNHLAERTRPKEVFAVGSLEELSKQAESYTAGLAEVVEFKKKLLTMNVVVHRFLTENPEYVSSTLKGGISELYGMWHEYYACASERVSRLNGLLQTWQVLESRLEQLQGDLRDDEQTLGVLDTALQGGKFSNQMAVTVRDVAKLLSERKSGPQGLPELFTEGGSLSDSGISDEGSENDLGERERRLAAIRRLVRQMESVMAPDCEARCKMAEKLAAAEEELRTLQNKCRSLIVRTAAICSGGSQQSVLEPTIVDDDAGDDPPPVPGQPWFKRVMRAALPFHVALFALLCLACLLESNCCDNMNNFSMSLSPQLRYVRGPPPL